MRRAIAILLILMVILPSITISAGQPRVKLYCPLTDTTGQPLAGRGFTPGGDFFCRYGQPYDLTIFCPSLWGTLAKSARMVEGQLVCIWEDPR